MGKTMVQLAQECGIEFPAIHGGITGDLVSRWVTQTMLESFARAVRAEALEEAASECRTLADKSTDYYNADNTGHVCADAILALKENAQ